MLKLYIDGYNLLHQFAPGPFGPSEADLEQLISQLQQYSQAKRLKLTLVLDATRGIHQAETRIKQAGIQVIYTRQGTTADDHLVQIAQTLRGDCMIVSSDRGIATRTAGSGATLVSSGDFLMRLLWVSTSDKDRDDEAVSPARKGKSGNPKKLKKQQRLDRKRLGKI